MPKIAAGVVKFQKEVFPKMQALFGRLAEGQQPEALFITCSDSRIDPSLVTQTGPGELFICRNAGNIVHTAHTQHGRNDGIDRVRGCGSSPCLTSSSVAIRAAARWLRQWPQTRLATSPTSSEWIGFAQAAARIVDAHEGLDDEARLKIADGAERHPSAPAPANPPLRRSGVGCRANEAARLDLRHPARRHQGLPRRVARLRLGRGTLREGSRRGDALSLGGSGGLSGRSRPLKSTSRIRRPQGAAACAWVLGRMRA